MTTDLAPIVSEDEATKAAKAARAARRAERKRARAEWQAKYGHLTKEERDAELNELTARFRQSQIDRHENKARMLRSLQKAHEICVRINRMDIYEDLREKANVALGKRVSHNRTKVPAIPRPAAEMVHIYFIQAASGDGAIKIVSAVDPRQRLRTFQFSSPVVLAIRTVLKNVPRSREFELHAQFKSLRLHGEWFRPEQELLDFIASLKDAP